ncbi:Clp protease ClpP [Rhodoferax sp. 4810]|uniref:ATP-dependent Clp protease proteolytic subunit n=1 Tax=Thiospirillum jenense TaxID=1653858 RepID=A0A839HH40_9GAMM|nr:head maturation protease, ClpP-related [Thiospirillum jenense]MBB1074458.1 Clp protease ClpP [Rhodoferax jenense]MBB1125562.1 Clp protease ClpP [Thiospirillum jenense]
MSTEIQINGSIGYELTAQDFIAAIKSTNDDVVLKINSPGGNVADGIAIHNAIRAHQRNGRTVTADIIGMAASMATYIAVAADHVRVEDNSVWMVHNPWTMEIGDYRTMEKTSGVLRSLTNVLAKSYSKKTGNAQQVTQDMDQETWLYGEEIVAAGYADSVIDTVNEKDKSQALVLASIQFNQLKSKLCEETPDFNQIAAMIPQLENVMTEQKDLLSKAEETPTEEQIESPPQPVIESPPQPVIESPPQPAIDVSSVVKSAVAVALAAERQRVSAIQQRCAQVNMPHLIDSLIASAATPEQTDKAIIDAWLAKGGVEIKQNTSQTDAVSQLQSAITAYQAQHGVSIAQATAAVLKANPELYEG